MRKVYEQQHNDLRAKLMGAIPNYDQWIKDTYSLTSPRSEFLKKLDETIKANQGSSSPAAREAVRVALDSMEI